jgi:hypothetical protein
MQDKARKAGGGGPAACGREAQQGCAAAGRRSRGLPRRARRRRTALRRAPASVAARTLGRPRTAPPPAAAASRSNPPSLPPAPPGATLELIRLIFLSTGEEAPSSFAQFVAPHFVSLQPGASLYILDGGTSLTIADEAVAAAQFRAVLSLPEIARAIREWKIVIYSVRAAAGMGTAAAARAPVLSCRARSGGAPA